LPKSSTQIEDHFDLAPAKPIVGYAKCFDTWQQKCTDDTDFFQKMAAIGQDEWLERLSATTESTRISERRRSHRVPLRWTLFVALPGGTYPKRTATENLSRDGFYCLFDEPVTAGQYVDCDIVVPSHLPDCKELMSLRCRAQVIRVEKIDGSAQYGFACRIEDYRLIHACKEFDSSRVRPAYAG
jgi:hypothetical protein